MVRGDRNRELPPRLVSSDGAGAGEKEGIMQSGTEKKSELVKICSRSSVRDRQSFSPRPAAANEVGSFTADLLEQVGLCFQPACEKQNISPDGWEKFFARGFCIIYSKNMNAILTIFCRSINENTV